MPRALATIKRCARDPSAASAGSQLDSPASFIQLLPTFQYCQVAYLRTSSHEDPLRMQQVKPGTDGCNTCSCKHPAASD
eukprot:9540-Lingulodinium_polyedra.AAC.1